MEANEISKIVDSMFEDELDVLSQLLSLSDPERSDAMILRENGRPFRDACGCAMSKNGTDGTGQNGSATDAGRRFRPRPRGRR